jgi:carboxyl-terminal processing protease
MKRFRLGLIVVASMAIGLLCGFVMFSDDKNTIAINSGVNKMREILTYVNRDYVDTVNVEKLIDFSIQKMLAKLDPHTVYITKAETEQSKIQLESNFDGIGVEFNIIKDTIVVVAPITGGPSEQLGIMSGDKIINIDNENVAGVHMTNMGVFKRLRGPKGTKVKVQIKRGKSPKLFDYTITRDKIPSISVEVGYMMDDSTGYIKASRFTGTTDVELHENLDKLKKKGMKRLVLDLRDNSGGYLNVAVKMVDEFLNSNKTIVYTKSKNSRYDQRYTSSLLNDGLFEKGPLVVLINEGSASASEILSGALQDNDRALVVGRRSFGKGLVQMPIPLTDGSELRLTISRYYIPSGRCIQKPYSSEDEGDSYQKDLYNRFKHGEFFHADSIKMSDSLKYKTSSGRMVYGGGGIMPDFFVPRDTTPYTGLLVEMYNKDVIREFALKYYVENKKKLEKQSLAEFKKTFTISDTQWKEIIDLAKASGVKMKDEELKRSEMFVKSQIKALIARSVWKNEGFYSVVNESDEIVRNAVILFPKTKEFKMTE